MAIRHRVQLKARYDEKNEQLWVIEQFQNRMLIAVFPKIASFSELYLRLIFLQLLFAAVKLVHR